jgi:hypothetical protein
MLPLFEKLLQPGLRAGGWGSVHALSLEVSRAADTHHPTCVLYVAHTQGFHATPSTDGMFLLCKAFPSLHSLTLSMDDRFGGNDRSFILTLKVKFPATTVFHRFL